MLRRLIPHLLLPLALIANVVATDPWLRAFPSSVAAVPLFGAAVLSVLIPAVVQRLGARLWLGALVDLAALVGYLLFVVLHDPGGFGTIVSGVQQGPSQILTFALPLVSPRSLMVGPVVLVWIAGAVAGECLARRWATLLPYIGLLVSFGLAYAATQRAASGNQSSIQLRETLFGGVLLVVLLLIRTAQAWVRQEESAQSTQADGVLPARGFVVGVVSAVVIAAAASLVVQASAFPKRATTPQRRPLVDSSKPLAPLQFIAGVRPAAAATAKPQQMFDVDLSAAAPGYFGIANVDFYDGSGWSFDRTFRPSGGVLPDDTDASLDSHLTAVTQDYTIHDGPLADQPWIPTLYRAQRVTGTSVDIDATSGMIVPARPLTGTTSYTVHSRIADTTFAGLDAKRATPDTSTPAGDVEVPPTLRATLDRLIRSFASETGTPSQPALPFLHQLQHTLLTDYALSPPAQASALGTRSPSSSSSSGSGSSSSSSPPSSGSPPDPGSEQHTGHAAATRRLAGSDGKSAPKHPGKSAHSTPNSAKHSTSRSAPPSTSPSASDTADESDLAGGTGFADIVASVLGQHRSGTPEQFATLIALIARELGVPARVVTGFRVVHGDSANLAAGAYHVSADQAWTWTEVPIVGKGWLVLDATPSEFANQNSDTDTGVSTTPSVSSTPSQALISQSSSGGHAVASPVTPPAAARSSASHHGLLVALLIAGAALVLVLGLVLLSRKRLRRARRRRSADPRKRLIGAWQESLDMLTESGLPPLDTLTSAEIAVLVGEQFGSVPAGHASTLGRAANAVAYSATTVVVSQQVDQAWAMQRTLQRTVRRQLSIGGRTRAVLRYHRSRKVRAGAGPDSWAEQAAARAETESPPPAGRVGAKRYRGRRRR